MTGAVASVREARVSGHFGEWMQGRLGAEGPLALISVDCAPLAVSVQAVPGPFSVTGDADPEVAAQFFRALGGLPGFSFRVDADAVPGGGAGMSTAALLAMARAIGADGDPVCAALSVEGAVDPLAEDGFDRLLWASREARVVERFDPLPEFRVVGGFWGGPEQTDPSDTHFPDIADMVPMWRDACARSDRAALAGLATEATRRTTALRGPGDDPTLDIARDAGALGIIRAHTGSARGLLFAPDTDVQFASNALREAGYASVLSFATGGSS